MPALGLRRIEPNPSEDSDKSWIVDAWCAICTASDTHAFQAGLFKLGTGIDSYFEAKAGIRCI
jgi:hypothetical protein